jgi:tetratricopeptide (TPR) repeat protein
MTRRTRVLFGLLFLIAVAIHSQKAASSTDPDKDPQMLNLLQEARTLIDGKKLTAAIKKCDDVIANFKTHYGSQKEKIYCARTSAETLGYLLKAAADKQSAKALSSTWSDAYFMKAYALQDLGRMAEAKSAVKRAVELSPWNPRYLSELGNIYQLEKDWPKAKEAFETAEDQAPLSPDDVKAEELRRARRGLAYVLVELGKLAEAEKKYQQCLAADPNDTRAARELEYVRGLRAKTKSK